MGNNPEQSQIDDYGLKEVSVRLRLADERYYYGTSSMSNPGAAALLLRDIMKELDREWLCVVNLDTKNRPINFNIVSVGNINSSIADMSNIFKAAILSNASNLIIAHNHPSGDRSPSKEDLLVTETALNAGRLLNIPVLDHLIFAGGTDDYYSIRENNESMFADTKVSADFLEVLKRTNGTARVAEQKAQAESEPAKKMSMKDVKSIAASRRAAAGGTKEPRKRERRE